MLTTVRILSLGLLAIVAGVAPAFAGKPGQRILSCEQFPASISASQLEARFGKSVVISTQVYVGEGESEEETVLFPNSMHDRIGFEWANPKTKDRIVRICVNDPKTNWRTTDGISIGTDLKAIQRINGGPFNLAGFGWDGGGATESWQNGKLGGKGCELQVILIPDFPESDQHKAALYNHVMGDRPFSSANPVMQELNPTVRRLCLFYK